MNDSEVVPKGGAAVLCFHPRMMRGYILPADVTSSFYIVGLFGSFDVVWYVM